MPFTNPFSGRYSEGTSRNLTAYRVFSLLSFLLAIITTIAYTNSAPHDGKWPRRTIFGQSDAHITPFTENYIFVSIYWIVLYVLQVVYIAHLFGSDEVAQIQATSIGSHFILFNLLQFAWVMLWCRSHFFWSEVVQVINFLQLTMIYLCNPTTPRLIHASVLAMPLTYTFFMVFWNGAVMVHCHSLPCRILANVAIWGILVYALFFLLAFKDYHVGFATAFLTAGLGVGQFFTKVIALQWIFAFTIMAVVFFVTLVVAIPGIIIATTRASATGDSRERAPLLEDA
ncbi:hypothetical protein RUND412_010558 [Rhizina undulata]